MEEFQIIDHYLLVRMPKEVDHHQADYLSRQADHYIINQKINDVIFDFTDTTFMDSSGIGIIMGRYKKVSCFGGKIYIVNADRQMKRILYLSGMDKFLEIVEGSEKYEYHRRNSDK